MPDVPPVDKPDKTVEYLIQSGRLLVDVPHYAMPLFLSLVNKYASDALAKKELRDQAGWEKGVLDFVVNIRRALHSVRAGSNRNRNTLNFRLQQQLEESDEFVIPAPREVRDGKDEKVDEKEVQAVVASEEKKIARSCSLVYHNLMHEAARVLSQEAPKADLTPELKAELATKIPQTGPVPIPRLPPAAPVRILDPESAAFLSLIRKKSTSTSTAGPSSLSFRHIRRISQAPLGRKMIAAICTDLLNGAFSQDMKALFCSSMGTALPKGDGTHRAIGAGDCFRRLVASHLAHSLKFQFSRAAGDFQTGVGKPAGCEKIIHSLQAALEQTQVPLACIEVDIVNAFNTRSRTEIFRTLFSCPDLSPCFRFLNFCYSHPSRVYFAEAGKIQHSLMLYEGVEQGDPLGGNLFSLDLSNDIKAAMAVDTKVKIIAFHDNVFIVGPPSRLPPVFEKFRQEAEPKGSKISFPKSRVLYWHDSFAPLSADFLAWSRSAGIRCELGAVKVLGCPIGPAHASRALEAMALDIVKRNEKFFTRLSHPEMPVQLAFALLRLCGVPRWNYINRVLRPSAVAGANAIFDTWQTATILAKGEIREREWNEGLRRLISLPLRLGGMGIRYASDTSVFAWFAAQAASAEFLSGFLACFGIDTVPEPPSPLALETKTALDRIKASTRYSQATITLPEAPGQSIRFYADPSNAEAIAGLQKALTSAAEESVANRISNRSDDSTAALIKSRCETLAHLWKETVPTDPSLVLSNSDFVSNLRVEFGLPPVPSEDLVDYCGMCGSVLLASDCTHFLNCKFNAAIITRRHNECTNIIANAIRDLQGYPTVEPRKLWNNNRTRPDIDAFISNKRFLIDFTCRNDFAPSNRSSDVMAVAEKEKIQHYSEMARVLRAHLLAFVCSAFGGFGKGALNFMRDLRHNGNSRNIGETPNDVVRFMCRRVAIAIHRVNGDAHSVGISRSRKPIPAGFVAARSDLLG